MNDDLTNETAEALQREWDLQLPATVSKETLLILLAGRVALLMDRDTEAFFQLMYRLDITEKKLTAVLYNDDATEQIALLIYDRQLQKIHSRNASKGPLRDNDPDLKW